MFRNAEPQLSVDIVSGAGLTVIETPTKGLAFGLHRPFAREEDEVEQAAFVGIG